MLKRVSIQNFKSLKDVTLDLQKVNLLIGPNNSGKTNFLKALEFVANLEKESNFISINYIFKKDSSKDLLLHFAFDNQMPFDENSAFTHYKVGPEKSQYHRKESTYLLSLSRADTKEYDIMPKSMGKQDTHLYNVQIEDMYYDFGNLFIYRSDVNKLTSPYPLLPNNEIVNEDSSNIVAYLDTIRDKYPDTFNKIQHDLTICVPEFSQLRFDNVTPSSELEKIYGDKTYKVLGLHNEAIKNTFWANELSEGTLYFLALLCIINQPNPPKLLLLEEPEKGIHPRRIREVMDFIFRLAEEKDVQIILTSHNEHVLDDFATRPESVFVFDKDEEGATYVRNLQTDIIEPTNQRNQELGLDDIDLTTNLSENWLYGLLGGVPAIP